MYTNNDWRFYSSDELYHHGIKGQKWGVKNGPPYPLDSSTKKQQREFVKKYFVATKEELYKVPNSKFASGIDEYLDRGMTDTQLEDGLKYKQQLFEESKKGCKVDPRTGLLMKNKECSFEEDMAMINPTWPFSVDRQSNCANCSIALEARRRGYNVQAGPNEIGMTDKEIFDIFPKAEYGGFFINDTPSECIEMANRNHKSKVQQFKSPDGDMIDGYYAKKVLKDCIDDITQKGDGTRGLFIWGYMDERSVPYSGHVSSYEVRNGEMYIVEPQTNFSKKIDLNDGSYCCYFQYLRTDNLDNSGIDWDQLRKRTA